MEISQHYYTSYINRETGSAGFQVKAMSPAISPDTQNMILRLIAYRIPASLDERAFKTHPRALRFYPFNKHECLLISSRSNGSDPNGRPGNFFAHTLVVDPQTFTTVPPILYWESDFWRIEDTETRQKLETLPEIPGDPALDINAMWTFLQQEAHLDIFFKLMCAVVHGVQSHHRIIIIDSDEHVAYWIAAVSCMLPPAYRPLLSFTTYHHDPYQSQFFITGTPYSPELRLTPEDYTSYFILNMHENKISSVDNSLYAELTRMHSTSEQYENDMLTFFSRFAYRFPNPTMIDEQLDSITLYASIMSEEGSVSLTHTKLLAISQVLPTFEQLTYYDQQDIRDLKHLSSFLRGIYQASDNLEANQLRQRIVDLLNQHKVPTDEIFKQDLIDYTYRLFGNYASDTATIALQGLEHLLQEYGSEKFIDQANQLDYLSMLLERVMQSEVQYLTRLWRSIGPYLLPGTITGKIFAQSIFLWGQTSATLRKKVQDDKPVRNLFNALQNAISLHAQDWFTLLVAKSAHQAPPIPPLYLGLFYCQFVFALPLEQREPYRSALLPIFHDLVDVEFAYDLSKVERQAMLSTIKTWVIYAQLSHLCSPSTLVAQGLILLHKHYQSEPAQWSRIARQCLVDSQLTPYLDQWEGRLLEDAFSALSLSQFDQEHLPLYQHYRNHRALPDRNRTIINGLLAMHDHHLDPQLAQQLYQYAVSLSDEVYEMECSSFCNSFFTAQLSDDDHFYLLDAFFVWHYSKIFWQIYWEKICIQSAESLARLLSFWFTLRPISLARPYVTQGFLLSLHQNLQHAQKMPDFQKALNQLTSYPWYTAIQESTLNRKNAFLIKGQDLMKQVQKRLPNQKADEEAEEQKSKLLNETHKLFEKRSIRERHLSILMPTYQAYTPSQFWETYKEHLIQLLLSNDVQHVFEFFSFWFTESFSSFGHYPFIAQSFFIGLPQVFELADKDNQNELHKLSLKMHEQVKRDTSSYAWYGLLHNLFPEQPKTAQRLHMFKR